MVSLGYGVAMKESAFEKSFMSKAKTLPKFHAPPKSHLPSIAGLPDRVFCLNGRYIALEFKRSLKEMLKGSASSKLQEYTLFKIEAAGGYAVFVYPENAEVVFNRLREIANV
jgi:hypothetical protein